MYRKSATGVTLALLFVMATLCAASAQTQQKSLPHEQRAFGEGDNAEIKHPVPVPAAVVKLLMETEAAKDGIEYDPNGEDAHASEWFHASVIHLSRSDDADLLIEGSFPMSGADNNWYWIVLSAYKNPRIVLFAGCLEVYVLHHRHNGYQDITTEFPLSISNTENMYRFDGKEYKLWKHKETYPYGQVKPKHR